jgi:hypothetical protein
MTNQILALADRIEKAKELPIVVSLKAVKELRRLHEVNVELLEALKEYVRAGVGFTGTDWRAQIKALQLATPAIAKATGETE